MHQARGALQRTLQLLAHGLQYLDAREQLVVGWNQVPRRHRRAGALHHVAHGTLVFAPFFAIAPVLFGDLAST